MADWTSGATGAISGAGTGATIGGPWGAAIGGVAGGLAGLFGGGKKKKPKRISSFDKRQQALNQQQHDSILGTGPLADLYNYDPEAANAVFDQTKARPAQRKFAENTVPTITGAFRNQGLQNSSYVGDALSKAGREVQENLDALRSEYLYNEQKDARTAKRSAVDSLQNRTTFTYDVGPKPFDISTILNSITPEMKKEFRDFFTKKTPPAQTGETT